MTAFLRDLMRILAMLVVTGIFVVTVFTFAHLMTTWWFGLIGGVLVFAGIAVLFALTDKVVDRLEWP